MPKPKVSVIIPTYNRADQLRRSVESILAQTFTDFELLICDNNSRDNTAEYLKTLAVQDPRIKPCFCERPGAAATRNTALSASCGEIIAFLDDDCVAPPHWLEGHLQFYQRKEVGGVGGPQWPADDNIVDAYLVSRYLEENLNYFEITDPNDPMKLATCNASYRRSLFELLGGFDESYLSSGEDVNFTLRVLKKGYTVIKDPNLKVMHLKVMNFTSFCKMIFARTRGVVLDGLKNHIVKKYSNSTLISWRYLKKNLRRFRSFRQRPLGLWEKLQVIWLSIVRYYVNWYGYRYHQKKCRGIRIEEKIPPIK